MNITDAALDRIAASRATVPTPHDSDDDNREQALISRDRLLAMPDDQLLLLAKGCASCEIEQFLAAALRRAIREERELPTVVQALYDADELEQAAEARRQDSDGWLA